MLKLIVATDKHGGIAKDGDIPWRCRTDMDFFRTMTQDSPMIMGRKTWDTLPLVVQNRKCIVLSRVRAVPAWRETQGVRETIRMALELNESVFVIGGESIYQKFLPFCGVIYRTAIPHDFECDQFFCPYPGDWERQNFHHLEGPVYNKSGAEVTCETPYVELLMRTRL